MSEEYVVSTSRTGGDNLLPEGIYQFQVMDAEVREGSKAPYWNFELDCVDAAFRGRKVWAIVSLSESSRWRMDQFLDAFAVPEGLEVTCDDFLNRVAFAKIKHEEYEGKKKAKVAQWIAGDADAEKSPKPKSSPPTPKIIKPVVIVEDEEEEEEEVPAEEEEVVEEITPTKTSKPKAKRPW